MRGVTSLEQFLDEQTEKRSDIALLLEQNGVVLPPARTSALAAPSAQAPAEAPTEQHLCWNGLRVSPEFERYAARVAQGEDLPPFRGPVLASASAFPWSLGESHTATTRLSEPPAVQVPQLGSGAGPTNIAPAHLALPAPRNSTIPPSVVDAPRAGPPAPWTNAQRAIVAGLLLGVVALGKSTLSLEHEVASSDDIAWPTAVRALRPSAPPVAALDETLPTVMPRVAHANEAPSVVAPSVVRAAPLSSAPSPAQLASRTVASSAPRPVAKPPEVLSASTTEPSLRQSTPREEVSRATVAAAPSDLFVHEVPF